jgi:hypothetical protein
MDFFIFIDHLISVRQVKNVFPFYISKYLFILDDAYSYFVDICTLTGQFDT